jgi:hypothetical protein
MTNNIQDTSSSLNLKRFFSALKGETLISAYQVLGATATLIIFFTGYSSLPAMFGRKHLVEQNIKAVLPTFDPQVQVALILIGAPLFNFIDTWLAISLSKLIARFFSGLGINCLRSSSNFSPVYYVTGITILVPVIVGINMLFLVILFGSYLKLAPILLGILSITATAIYYFFWFSRYRHP